MALVWRTNVRQGALGRRHVKVGITAPRQQVSWPPTTLSRPLSEVGLMPAEERARLAKEWGYKHVGKELPDNVRLADIVQSLPSDVVAIDNTRAWLVLGKSVVLNALAIYLISISPAWALPFSWFFAGTALTGFFVIGHECGHKSFHTNKVIEDIIGHLVFMPLVYPFYPWRIKHDEHHVATNKLYEDTAWHPIMDYEAEQLETGELLGPVGKPFLYAVVGSPLRMWGSIIHWLEWHFDASRFREHQRRKLRISWAFTAITASIGFPWFISTFGWGALAKYWLMPFLGYHFWLSVFTLVQHTAPHIPFKPAHKWNAAKAQLNGTVHCGFPWWVEFMCHDINFHVPHHIISRIPSYNLRKAEAILEEKWGEYMTIADFSPKLLKTMFTELHLYDERDNYVPLDKRKGEMKYLAVQRKYLPE